MTQTKTATARGFDFVMYQTKEMPRLRSFYESLFDLTPGAIDSEHFVEYDLGDGNTFAIGHHPTAPFVAMGGIFFNVEDAAAMGERVKELGGRIEMSVDGPACTSHWCTDPDGNYFGVHQRR